MSKDHLDDIARAVYGWKDDGTRRTYMPDRLPEDIDRVREQARAATIEINGVHIALGCAAVPKNKNEYCDIDCDLDAEGRAWWLVAKKNELDDALREALGIIDMMASTLEAVTPEASDAADSVRVHVARMRARFGLEDGDG